MAMATKCKYVSAKRDFLNYDNPINHSPLLHKTQMKKISSHGDISVAIKQMVAIELALMSHFYC